MRKKPLSEQISLVFGISQKARSLGSAREKLGIVGTFGWLERRPSRQFWFSALEFELAERTGCYGGELPMLGISERRKLALVRGGRALSGRDFSLEPCICL